METYNGQVRTPNDAIILFEACRLGLLPRVQRRLSEKERQSIRSGSVFVWDEREAGMRRWTDGKSWSASRVSGSFLTYREMEGKRGSSSFVTPVQSRGTKTPDSGRNSAEDQNAEGEEGPDGYRYKPDGLMKQSFSLTTSQGQHLHLISYYSRSHPAAGNMRQPSNDPSLAQIQIPKGMYPESTLSDNTPPTTRSPMTGVAGVPGYAMAGPNAQFNRPPPLPHGYYVPHPGFMYPMSPVHTPPGYPLYHPAGMPALGYPPHTGQPPFAMNQAPPSHLYDQRPQRAGMQPVSSPTGAAPPPSNVYSPYGQSQPPPPVDSDSQSTPQPPRQEQYAPLQIDPRLTGSAPPPPAPTNGTPTQSSAPPPAPAPSTDPSHPPNQPYDPTTSSASQIPTIGALVHAPKSPRPGSNSGPDSRAEKEGSTSPGGTRHGAPPQDIPSEKLAFREDKMALSKLDRVFARV